MTLLHFDSLHAFFDDVGRWSRLSVLFLGMPLYLCNDLLTACGPDQEHAVGGLTLELMCHTDEYVLHGLMLSPRR